jgi:hypothetical protein
LKSILTTCIEEYPDQAVSGKEAMHVATQRLRSPQQQLKEPLFSWCGLDSFDGHKAVALLNKLL